MNATYVASAERSRISMLSNRAHKLWLQAESRPTSSARFELLHMADMAAAQLGAEYHRRGFRRVCPGIIGQVDRLKTQFLFGYNAAAQVSQEAHDSVPFQD